MNRNLFTISVREDPLLGFYARVIIAGRTLHGTPYFKTEPEAVQNARDWIAAQRKNETPTGPTGTKE